MIVPTEETSRNLVWRAVGACTLLVTLVVAGCGGPDGPAAVEPDASVSPGRDGGPPDATGAPDATVPVTPDATVAPDAAFVVPSIDPRHVVVGADFDVDAIARDSTGALIIASKRHTVHPPERTPDDRFESVRLTRYDASGAPVFRHVYGGNPRGGVVEEVYIGTVLVDAAGDITIIGSLRWGDVAFGAQRIGDVNCSALRPFVARLAPDGTHRWARMPTMPCREIYAGGAVLTPGGDLVFLMSSFPSSIPTLVDFGGGGHEVSDGLLVRLDPNGVEVSSRTLFTRGAQSSVFPGSLVLAPNGELYLNGTFNGSVTGGTTTLSESSFNMTGFLGKLDSAGTPVWLRRLGGIDQTWVYPGDLALGSDGDLIAVGQMSGQVDFGQGEVDTQFTHRAWIARYDGTGGLRRVDFVDHPTTSTRVRALQDGTHTWVSLAVDGATMLGSHPIAAAVKAIAFEITSDGSIPAPPLTLTGKLTWALLQHGTPVIIE